MIKYDYVFIADAEMSLCIDRCVHTVSPYSFGEPGRLYFVPMRPSH